MSRPSAEKASGPKQVQSVLRAMEVLEVIAQSGTSCSISYISEETGIPSPTVFRLLNTMTSRGWVIKTSRREYSVGAAFFSLTTSAGASVGSAMDEALSALAAQTGESVSAATLEKSSAIHVAHQSSNRAMRLFTEVGNRVPLYATGVGKSLLAGMSDRDLNAYLRAFDGVPLTEHTITDRAALAEEIAKVRKDRLAFDREEQEIGVRCAATWVPGVSNFAVSVSGPPNRMSDEYVYSTVQPALNNTVESLADVLSKPGLTREEQERSVPPVYMGLGI